MPLTRSRRSTPALALICAAQFVLQLDFSIVNVALPSVQRHLHMPPAELQWLVTGYALTFGSLLLVGGRVADLLGRRRLLVGGLASFGLASLAAGLAQSSLELIIARVLQGAAGAMVSPAALSLLTTTNAEGPARARALAIWQATTAAGATSGIIAGGVLTQYLGWRAIFLVNPILVTVMLVLVRRLLPEDAPGGGRRLDVAGAVFSTAALACLIFGLSNGQQHGFGSLATVVALGGAPALAAVFLVRQHRTPEPMVPWSLFADATRRAAFAAMVLMGAIVAGYVYFVSLYLQHVERYSPLAAGLSIVPATVTVILTTTFGTRRLLARFGVKALLLAGLAGLGAGQLWLSRVSVGAGYATAVLPGLIFTALGVGLAFPTASIAITTGVQRSEQGLAGALFTTAQQVGGAVGLALLATVAAGRSAAAHSSLTAGYRLAFLLSAGIAIVATAIVAGGLSSASCQEELGRQTGGESMPAREIEASLRKC